MLIKCCRCWPSLTTSSTSFSTMVPFCVLEKEKHKIKGYRKHRMNPSKTSSWENILVSTSGSSKSRREPDSRFRRSTTVSLQISKAETLKTKSLSWCCEIERILHKRARYKLNLKNQKIA